jgi:hypothetical protein
MRVGSVAVVVALVVAASSLAEPTASQARQARPACAAIAQIGDSLTVPIAGALRAAYHRLGWGDVRVDAHGGRAIIERLSGDVNGLSVVARLRESGFHGCWVVALGTNDAANVAIGAVPGARTRIERMLDAIGNEPVLWVDVALVNNKGAYTRAAAGAFNTALRARVSGHSKARVFAWSTVVQRSWFGPDGVHYTSRGSLNFTAYLAAAVKANFAASM